MQTNTTFQNTALLILRIITAVIFYVAAYFKIPFRSRAPEGIRRFYCLLQSFFLSLNH